MKKIIPYGKHKVLDEDIEAVVAVLRSDFLTQGPLAEEFEKKMCDFLGCKYAVAVSNGTAALHLSAMALGVSKGDKILVVTNSFVSSANCVKFCGGDVDFVDIDPDTFCISLEHLEKKINNSPKSTYKGIIAVDFAGLPGNFEEISSLAKRHGLWVIEDACHALGASFEDSSGSVHMSGDGHFSDVSVFSFHAVKHVATGEGGMITTNNKEIYNQLKLLRTHGITKDPALLQKNDGDWYYEMQGLGYNYRIPDILCALGVSQLSRIEQNLSRRREIASAYESELGYLGITPRVSEKNQHAYHLYIITTDRRDDLYNFLNSKNIKAQIHYIPIHTQPYYRNESGKVSLENAEDYYKKTLSLPIYHSMSDEDLSYVISSIKSFY
ncbi:UDP-4-amino-4,6-dideoxy-N-acetyl-beta-L-altrosamine transaminase [Halobacteriovorax marinus]|uniref:UDP-4-amino-4, 6-dideoxy-N-acetyl-beta-L-altrosamine transaminase n=1 Tax=Halobacteriovorax marinus TaxID=97084 RepID=A0A1Y5FAX7_9BACT|nr:UDP-4-amino-4,6-dideoxy-N-acetyl-beta-L-altrosamine transaminase [Halobacteriovorax marinus]